MKTTTAFILLTTLFLTTLFALTASADVCLGTCGTLGANGDVTPAPGFSSYSYISTYNGINGVGIVPTGALGAETNGSALTTSLFTTGADSVLRFSFNYISSDGTHTFPDYAWAALENQSGGLVALLFTAQTTPTGNTSPAFGLPTPAATLTPSVTPINPGSATAGCATTPCSGSSQGPVWDPLGPSSGNCYADGCGLTGWITATYHISQAGTYQLAFGVMNYTDTAYDSGLAIDGARVNNDDLLTPEPSLKTLLGLGIVALLFVLRARPAHPSR